MIKKIRNHISLLLTLALFIVAIGCSSAPAERPGNPEVYSRIESLTDCKALQAEFNTAMDWHDRESTIERKKMRLAYAKAADKRLSDIGCY